MPGKNGGRRGEARFKAMRKRLEPQPTFAMANRDLELVKRALGMACLSCLAFVQARVKPLKMTHLCV